MTRKLQAFVKKLNGSAIVSQPSVKLTDKKIDKIFYSIKLKKGQTVHKLLEH